MGRTIEDFLEVSNLPPAAGTQEDIEAQPGYRELWPRGVRRPIVGFAAWSGTGKTTLLRRIIPRLCKQGVRLAVIKHAHHGFEIDIPGKDSYEVRHAGASQVLVTSARRRALIMERALEYDPCLEEEIEYLDQESIDLILVEGFRHARLPKIELRRRREQPGTGTPLAPEDPCIIAIATDFPEIPDRTLPVFDLNDIESIVQFILNAIMGRGSA
ncbi:MAG TPA: molybdopterin-guanine dinucleotide biosynthesis protein B [Nitrococcus sp.]|nr:molybdopterin-guanine dinucleotide biosynthesis protein B [Nitrococcus sp.]